MYCSSCGTDAGQAGFCPNCGASLLGAKPSGNVETFNLITAYKSMFKKYASLMVVAEEANIGLHL